jgi:hypothetical protein
MLKLFNVGVPRGYEVAFGHGHGSLPRKTRSSFFEKKEPKKLYVLAASPAAPRN